MTDDIVTWLRSILHNDRSVELRCQEAADEIERLREERDQARRLVCRHTKKTYRTLKEMAEERNWDCFDKEPDNE